MACWFGLGDSSVQQGLMHAEPKLGQRKTHTDQHGLKLEGTKELAHGYLRNERGILKRCVCVCVCVLDAFVWSTEPLITE